MSQLTDFYEEDGLDSENRSLRHILNMTDNELEGTHDCIQWLFPLREQSNFNADAPVLSDQDIEWFEQHGGNFYDAFERFIGFCGLQWSQEEEPDNKIAWSNSRHCSYYINKLEYAPNFDERAKLVWASFNHNMLRITRVLKSAKTLGFDDLADAFYAKCKEIYEGTKFKIPADTFGYWTKVI